MKKGMVIGALLAVMVMVLALGVFTFASAQTPAQGSPLGPGGMMGGRGGMMGGQGGYGRGMMGGARGQGMLGGAMHPYMVKAAAEALGMSEDALNAELTAGKTLWQVAEAQGKTAEEIPALLEAIHSEALAAMVADGVITKEQAEWMDSRMQGRYGGAGAGCPMHGGQGGGRWNTQPARPSTNG